MNESDAATAKAMLARGDRQHDVASWFGVNAGRIAEIATGTSFWWVTPDGGALPPPGPYPTGKQAVEAKEALVAARDALAIAEHRLESLNLY